ncbi:MAG: class I SAM-dependent methyltransferase [Stellaceae bacterium]
MAETLPGFFEGTGMPDPGWWEALWPEPARVLAQLGIAPRMSVIDLCSGDGWFTREIAKTAREVIAIDIDAALLATARVRLAESGLRNCRFVEGDAYGVADLVREPAEFVFLANAFHGVPDKPGLARAVHRALKPAGLFAIVNWHARPSEETTVLGTPRGPVAELRMTPQATIAAVEPSGFTLRQVVQLPPYHYGTLFERAG